MDSLYAVYVPSLSGALQALFVQLAILFALAVALVAYCRQRAPLRKCVGVVVGAAATSTFLIFALGVATSGGPGSSVTEFVGAFFELYIFVIVAGIGMVVGGLALAANSALAARSKTPDN